MSFLTKFYILIYVILMISFSININNKWHGNKDNICLLLNAVTEVILQKYELTIYAFTERNIRS